MELQPATVHIVTITDRCDFNSLIERKAFLVERNARVWANDRIVQLMHEREVAGGDLELYDPSATIVEVVLLG